MQVIRPNKTKRNETILQKVLVLSVVVWLATNADQ